MFDWDELLYILINRAVINTKLYLVSDIDDYVFGVGHNDALLPGDMDVRGQVISKRYIELEVEQLDWLLQKGYIIGGRVVRDSYGVRVEFDGENNLKISEEVVKACKYDELFEPLGRELQSLCRELVVQGHLDTAIREAMLLVETRLRDLSGSSSYGVSLVNECFGRNGSLADKFEDNTVREGFRDLFAGVFNLIRNDYAHNFRSPGLHDTVWVIQLADMLLRRLDALMVDD